MSSDIERRGAGQSPSRTKAVTEGHTITLSASELYGLVNAYELDGRPSSHPPDVRGYSTMNCYLLVEDGRALLFSTGYSVHQAALLAQLDELVDGRSLSLVIPRVEFASMCNARPIADRFHVDTVYQRLPGTPSAFLNIRPEYPLGASDGLQHAVAAFMRPDEPVHVDGLGLRALRFIMPELRLLPCNWAYDTRTRTLFTGDMFAWVWHDGPDGPWLLEEGIEDPTTAERVQAFLLHNRYWWLAGARTERLRRALDELFGECEIDVIAPDHGAILRGDAVDRHFSLLDGFLATARTLPAIGVTAGLWTSASTP